MTAICSTALDYFTMNLSEICDDRIFNKSYMISLALNKEIKSAILQFTKWMPSDTPLKIRALVIHLGYSQETFPFCSVCKTKHVTYEKEYQKSFTDYCGTQCSKKRQLRLSETARLKLNDKGWLFDQRINQSKSIEDIASIVGCSAQPIIDALKRFDIPKFKFNGSKPSVLLKLENHDWLYQRHVVERMKLKEIADEIGSSKATVSRWLINHGIERNSANSYERTFNKKSFEESELLNFIKDLLPNDDVISSNRSILGGMELDVYVPSMKIAFEYNGVYSHSFKPWHSKQSMRKDSNYHLNKTEKCKSLGIRLIHIFSDDWNNRNEIWKSIIKSNLNKLSFRYYARRLSIKDVPKHDKNSFLRNNHLQGNDKSSHAFGLYEDDNLIALMTFNKSRYNKNFEWELTRYCVKLDCSCVGGFSRLLSHFKNHFKGSIISYADYSRSDGNVYQKNGFELIKKNPPAYYYLDLKTSEQRLHRSNFTKQKIKAPHDVTEFEYMSSLGYLRIYDCGTLTYVMNN